MAAEKNFTEIRYFVKNSTTTAAFAQTFVGSTSGEGEAYPWDDLDSDSSFTSIINNYEMKFPTILLDGVTPVNCTLTDGSKIVTALDGTPFNTVNAQKGDYLLYDDGDGIDNLKVLGVIETKIAGDEVELAKNAVIDTNDDYPVYILKKGGASVGFKANSSFYLLVRSSSFTEGLRDGVIWLSAPGTHANPTSATAEPSLGWGGGTNVPVNVNPEYFNFYEISVSNAADEPLIPIVETDIPCSIKRISGYTNGGNFANTDQYPYWVAYEVNPFANSSVSLDKKTTFKVQFSEDLPAGQLGLTSAYTWIQQGAL